MGHRENIPVNPTEVIVLVTAFMKVASTAQTIAAAVAANAARRLGDPRRLSALRTAGRIPNVSSTEIQADDVGADSPPCGSANATKSARLMQVKPADAQAAPVIL